MANKMKYGDLVQFEQIESVIQLLDAGRPDEAKKLVTTYVISDDMAERIAKLMIPQLSFDDTVDHKGVLIVGNYGTGKSHLMSVLSLVAEDAGYVSMIRHPKVAEAAEKAQAADAGKGAVALHHRDDGGKVPVELGGGRPEPDGHPHQLAPGDPVGGEEQAHEHRVEMLAARGEEDGLVGDAEEGEKDDGGEEQRGGDLRRHEGAQEEGVVKEVEARVEVGAAMAAEQRRKYQARLKAVR